LPALESAEILVSVGSSQRRRLSVRNDVGRKRGIEPELSRSCSPEKSTHPSDGEPLAEPRRRWPARRNELKSAWRQEPFDRDGPGYGRLDAVIAPRRRSVRTARQQWLLVRREIPHVMDRALRLPTRPRVPSSVTCCACFSRSSSDAPRELRHLLQPLDFSKPGAARRAFSFDHEIVMPPGNPVEQVAIPLANVRLLTPSRPWLVTLRN